MQTNDAASMNMEKPIETNWHLVFTKPNMERCALENLERQGYICYLPNRPTQKIARGELSIIEKPLFPRYLFICLRSGKSGQSVAPIRSSRGVSKLVSFGNELAKVPEALVEAVRAQENLAYAQPEPLFKSGERVRITEGPFAGVEAIYQIDDGERRVLVLIEMMQQLTQLKVPLQNLQKIG